MRKALRAVADRERSTSTQAERRGRRLLLTIVGLAAAGIVALAPVSQGAGAGAPPAPVAKAQGAGAPTSPAPPAAEVRLSRTSVPAQGEQQALLTVEHFGRYAVRATSSQGTALRVIDRMAGELGAAGKPGHENGRLDLFLDRGSYKIVAESDEHGDGTAQLSAVAFRETSAAAAPQLVETKLISANLQDLRQVSYWLQLASRTDVRLEAAGRDLAELRFWRDGSWLEDVTPQCAAIDATPGQPLLRCEIIADLNAGLYLVTAYGGPGQPWAIESPEHPLYLRWGAPRLAETGRRRYQISPFGEDRFQLPDVVNEVHLEVPQAQALTVTAGWLEPWQALSTLAASGGQSAEIKKTSIPPVATLQVGPKPAPGTRPSRQAPADAAAPPAAATIDQDEADETTTDTSEAPTPEPPAAISTSEAPPAAETDSTNAPADAALPTIAQEGDEPAAADSAIPAESNDSTTSSTGDEPSTAASDSPTPDVPETSPLERASGASLWVAVKGVPGQDYVLEHFERQASRELHVAGRYLLASVTTGEPRDAVDSTALLTSLPANPDDKNPIADRLDGTAAVEIDSAHAWGRRFNLLAPFDLFVAVHEKGIYEIVAAGGGVFRIEPFLTTKPKGYKTPPLARSGSQWNLDAGVYVLSGQPTRKGIVTLGVRPLGKFPDLLREASGATERDPVRAAVRFAPVDLAADRRYTLRLNHQPGVDSGLVVRPWPVDLTEPLPLAQRPDETVALEFTVPGPGALRAETTDGRLIEVSVDGAAPQNVAPLVAGPHRLEIRGVGSSLGPQTQVYTLWFEPAALASTAPLPELPASALAALPKFPLLRPGSAQALDLGYGGSATFLVGADKPSLYQLQTTGVLATAATLRTRTVTRIAEASANGIGRNALVRQYLREGDFQATVSTIGASKGHLGVELAATPLREGGELRAEIPARITLAAGEGVVYGFEVPKLGNYRILAMGLGFVYASRLEDGDGWPVAPPNEPADLHTSLASGRYRLVLLPQAVGARAVTLLHREPDPPQRAGHGPHVLPLGHTVEQVWQEPAAVAEGSTPPARPPDLWIFELPAAATMTLTLDAEMEGSLTRLGPGAAAGSPEVGHIPPGRALSLELEAGRYQVAVSCSRHNSLVRYHLHASTAELVDGDARLLEAPVSIPVSLGNGGLVQISSYSASDVRARLYASDGALVADEDDRPDDWNFLISENLPAGRYRLDVEPVGGAKARLRLELRSLPEVAAAAAKLPVRQRVELANNVRVIALELPASGDLLLLDAHALDGTAPLGLALEVYDGAAWRRIASQTGHAPRVAVPVRPSGDTPRYRLRLWALDPGAVTAVVALNSVHAPRISERKLTQGAELQPPAPSAAGFPPLVAGVIELDRPGLVHLRLRGKLGTQEGASWRGSSVVSTPLQSLGGENGHHDDEALVAVAASPGGARFWVVADAAAAHLIGERVVLGAGREAGLTVALPGPTSVATWDLSAAGKASAKAPSGPIVALASAPAGQPAVELGEASASGPQRHAATLAVGPHAAVAVALAPQQPVAWTWSAEPHAATGTVGSIRLFQQRFARPTVESATWGNTTGELQAVVARQFTLPAGPKRIRLSLGRDMVGALSDEHGVLSTHWTGGAAFEELLDSAATRLTLFHLSERNDSFSVEMLAPASGEAELALDAAAPFVSSFDRAGLLRLRVPATDAKSLSSVPLRVWVTGSSPADPAPLFVDDRGTVSEVGSSVASSVGTAEPAPSGVLFIPHGADVVLAWASRLLDPGAAAAAAGWQGPLGAPAQVVAPPATVALAGHFAHLVVETPSPLVLHVRAVTPALVLFAHPATASAPLKPDAATLAPRGVGLDSYLPAGTTHLGLVALGDGALSGFAEVTTSPVLPAQEGLGPQVILPAGATRYFSFHLPETRTIGWSAAADSERVGCQLLHGDGRRVFPSAADDAALVAMAVLEAGDYLLAVTAPASAPPLRVRPVVVGLVPPSTGPPEDVVRSYLKEAGAQFAATEQSRPENHP